MPPISPNLFARPGVRDPRTLGGNELQAPTGEMDVSELLTARSEDSQVIARESRNALEALSRSFRRVEQFEYDPLLLRPPGQNLAGMLVTRLNRALNPQYDQRRKQKFEMLKTQQLVQIAQTMGQVAAQLRQADPAADSFIQSKMKEAGEMAGQMARVRGAAAMAAEATQILREEYGPDNVPPDMERRLMAHFAQIPTAEEIVKADIDLRAALAKIEPGLEDAEIPVLYKEHEGFLKKTRAHRLATETKKPVIAEFMQYKNLAKILNDQISAAEDDLVTPALVPGVGTDFMGRPTPKMLKLPRDPELVELARIRAAERFRRIVAANAGEGKIGRAFEILGMEDMIEFLDARGELTPEQQRDETNRVRMNVLEKLRAQAAGAAGGF